MRVRRAAVALVVGAAFAAASVLPAEAATLELFSLMNGKNEVPGPGDPDGRGSAIVEIRTDGRVCVDVAFQRIKPPTGFHIHRGTSTEAGPVVVDFTSLLPSGEGCVQSDPALLTEIRHNPAGFYTNVHNAQFPGGAIRGQLQRGYGE